MQVFRTYAIFIIFCAFLFCFVISTWKRLFTKAILFRSYQILLLLNYSTPISRLTLLFPSNCKAPPFFSLFTYFFFSLLLSIHPSFHHTFSISFSSPHLFSPFVIFFLIEPRTSFLSPFNFLCSIFLSPPFINVLSLLDSSTYFFFLWVLHHSFLLVLSLIFFPKHKRTPNDAFI